MPERAHTIPYNLTQIGQLNKVFLFHCGVWSFAFNPHRSSQIDPKTVTGGDVLGIGLISEDPIKDQFLMR